MYLAERANTCKLKLQDLGHAVCERSPGGADAVLARNTLGRFKSWGNNLGAFKNAESKSSLDHRLRKAPKMTHLVQRSLTRLEDAVSRGKNPPEVTTE